MTYAITGRELTFTVNVPRYRWELGWADGEECLIPRERVAGLTYTGNSGALRWLKPAANLDRDALLKFVNENAGLLDDGGPPVPEPILLWHAEATALRLLWLIRKMRLVTLEYDRWSKRSPLAPPDEEGEWMRRNASNLADLLQDLRPDTARMPPPDKTPEAVAAAWINATAAKYWVVEIPITDWAKSPIDVRAKTLALMHPVIRCRTLLGYAYAGLVIHYDERYRTFELSRAGKLPGVDPRPGHCQECARKLPFLGASGRKRRTDTKWCDDCRRDQNVLAQRKRRASAPAAAS
jgi:hypothetical protein